MYIYKKEWLKHKKRGGGGKKKFFFTPPRGPLLFFAASTLSSSLELVSVIGFLNCVAVQKFNNYVIELGSKA